MKEHARIAVIPRSSWPTHRTRRTKKSRVAAGVEVIRSSSCGSLIGILNDIGFDVMEHRIEKAQLVIEQTTITIAENGGKVKVTRVAKTQAEEEA